MSNNTYEKLSWIIIDKYFKDRWINVEKAPDPSLINWDNHGVKKRSRLRKFCLYSLIMFISGESIVRLLSYFVISSYCYFDIFTCSWPLPGVTLND